MKPCKKPGCTRPHRARGMCAVCYSSWRTKMHKTGAAGAIIAPPRARDTVLAAMPGASVDIQRKTELCRRTVEKWLRELRAEKVVRVCAWRRNVRTGPFVPVYAKGSAPDAKCNIVPREAEENGKKWERRKKRIGVKGLEALAEKARTRKQQKTAARRGDPLVQALFGKARGAAATPPDI